MNKENIIKFCKNALVTKARDDESEYVCFNEDTEFKPYWEAIKNILFEAGFEIQDFYYKTLQEAFLSISDYLNYNDLDDIENISDEITIESDVYTCDLLKWISESLNNQVYVDEVLHEIEFESLSGLLAYAQYNHKVEIYNIALKVISYLKEVE